ncbi:hypothetical protein [Flavobacterium hungaricum]|nr:hypothetical protein [Flavobacterium hungaricum]
MNNKPVKYLDNILKILAKDFGKSLSIQEIQNQLTPRWRERLARERNLNIFGDKIFH